MNMSFTHYRKSYLPNNNNAPSYFVSVSPLPIVPYASVQRTITPVQKSVTPELPKLKKMKWGEPTWFLFHTLAQKVKEENFNMIKDGLLNNIMTICGNLPCPACADHALAYMKKIQPAAIRTKQDLKNMLYVFHNEVNKRKGFDVFPHDQLDEKYSKANTVNIIQYFVNAFEDKHKSIHMIANDMHRGRITKKLIAWFQENLQYFDP
jgi:hypothetical protein